MLNLKTNHDWLLKNTIYLTIYGSQAYGTNTPESDLDIRGITIPPVAEYNLGILDNFEQAIFSEPHDIVIFGLSKFVKLAMDGNPNALEIIFTEDSDRLFISEIGKGLIDIRELFLSKKCRFTLQGYAHQQLKRLKTHRQWLLHPVENKPKRENFGLLDNHKLIPEQQMLEIEAEIKKKLDSWIIDTTGMENDVAIKFKNELHDVLVDLKVNHDDMDLYAARSLGLNDNLTEAFKKERAYKIALTNYKNYQNWKTTRNKKRAEIEAKYKIDWKHGVHLIRLIRQCIELLRDGQYNVKRHDAEELLAIRNGAWTFDQLMEWTEEQTKIVDELYKISTLRKEPNRKKINEWLINVLNNY